MKRALLPWLFPVAVLLGLLVASTNSPIVYAAVALVAGWGLAPLALAAARRNGIWPRLMQRDADARGPRIPGCSGPAGAWLPTGRAAADLVDLVHTSRSSVR